MRGEVSSILRKFQVTQNFQERNPYLSRKLPVAQV
jgi:hypothetical protein